jgi:hypothetical protein
MIIPPDSSEQMLCSSFSIALGPAHSSPVAALFIMIIAVDNRHRRRIPMPRQCTHYKQSKLKIMCKKKKTENVLKSS